MSRPAYVVAAYDTALVYGGVYDFDPDIRVECTSGIHFFITRREAEEYNS